MDALSLTMSVKANGIKVFEHDMRTEKSHCYKDISDSVLASLGACFLTESIFNWEIHRKDFGSAGKIWLGFNYEFVKIGLYSVKWFECRSHGFTSPLGKTGDILNGSSCWKDK